MPNLEDLEWLDFKGSDMTKIEELSIDLDVFVYKKPYIYSLKIIEKC